MKITHSSFTKIVQRDYGDSFLEILSKRTFSEFLSTINKISDSSSDYGYTDSEIEEDIKFGKYKFIGDLFEIFAEVFFIQYRSDNRVGVFDYKPVSADDDNGVDGFGKNVDGFCCTIQIKYRGNPKYTLKERDIKQFPYQSIINYYIDPQRSDNMIVFTNCEGLHWYTNSKVFDGRIRVINGEMISKMIDNNEGFWNTFKNLVTNSIKEMGVDSLTDLFVSKIDK